MRAFDATHKAERALTHLSVEEHDVRLVPFNQRDNIMDTIAFCDDFEVSFTVQNSNIALASYRMTVYYGNGDLIHLFWIRRISGFVQIIPNYVVCNQPTLRGQCSVNSTFLTAFSILPRVYLALSKSGLNSRALFKAVVAFSLAADVLSLSWAKVTGCFIAKNWPPTRSSFPS